MKAISTRRCPDSEDTDASFTPTELHAVDATAVAKKSPFLHSVSCTSVPNGGNLLRVGRFYQREPRESGDQSNFKFHHFD